MVPEYKEYVHTAQYMNIALVLIITASQSDEQFQHGNIKFLLAELACM